MVKTKTALDYFNEREDLKKYGGEGLGLFALALRYSEDDLDGIAASSILDGQDDKKMDILYLDQSSKTAFIMQCYLATSGKRTAKANKASDLNTAVAWAFSADTEKVPERIRSHVENLREAVQNGEVEKIVFWYVHNLNESSGVNAEMRAVRENANTVVRQLYSDKKIQIESQEVGLKTLDLWLKQGGLGISVSDEIVFETDGGFPTDEDDWNAYSTSISGVKLHELFKNHGLELFSLNVRDYLGSISKDTNINNGIQETAQDEPSLFWAFNNGITAIVNDFEVVGDKITIEGISIVNGAQTTGSIGNLDVVPESTLRVPIRFLKTNNPDLVLRIMRYNNSQNKVEASDFRSTDDIQTRLKSEFDRIGGFDYEGGRRGGVLNAIKRRPSLIPSYTMGQIMTAFHGEPVNAYNEKAKIWSNNSNYNKIFNDKTSAAHLIFVFTLFKKIEALKAKLRESYSKDSMSEDDKIAQNFLQIKGSHFYLIYVVSSCLETILQKPITSKFDLKFKDEITPNADLWDPVFEVLLPFSEMMTNHLSGGIRKSDNLKDGASSVRQVVLSIKDYHKSNFSKFSKQVSLI